MTAPLIKLYRLIWILLFLFPSALQSYGSHIFGADLYYTHVSSNTYTINLVVFGDCSGSAFPSLSTSAPVINVYNGNTFVTSVTLAVQAPIDGTMVSPVCLADAGSTTCDVPTSSIPGIKKFLYSGNIILSGPSTQWRFLFQGNMGGGELAGRSNSLTNILIPGTGSLIELTDTLNNAASPNSSPDYTSIATPFFCIDIPSNYNPGAVDPDGDELTFALTPAIDASSGGSVTYIFPYTGAAPLAVSPGTFSFNSANGQLSFTPNAVQRSLVVYNVEEHRGGVLVGTSQREMSFLVLSPCSSTPPTGGISAPSAGTVIGSNELNICSNNGPFNFQINPTDAGGDTIVMSVTGLPTGAAFNIVNNNTTSPQGTFNWNTIGVSPGIYTFYVAYIGKSCPLNSSQTIAYTIFVMAAPSASVDVLTTATCTREAIYTINPSGGPGPWNIDVLTGSTTVYDILGLTSRATDSLSPGVYTIRTYNAYGCHTDTAITIASPSLPTPLAITAAPLCAGGSTGSATITGTRGASPYSYAIDGGSYGSSGIFTGLSTGSYTISVKDHNGCIKDTVINIPATNPILKFLHIDKPLCNHFSNGKIIILAYNTTGPYLYAMAGGTYSRDDTFANLTSGTYTFYIEDAHGCLTNFNVTLTDSENIHSTLGVIPVPCHGDSATVAVYSTGGFGPPYTYIVSPADTSLINAFHLVAGTYSITVKDSVACFFDTTITITQPPPLIFAPVVNNVLCFDTYTGSVLVNVTGGTPGYLYDTLGGTFATSSTVTGLNAGTHIIQVKDGLGCLYNDTISLIQPPALVINSIYLQPPSCYNGDNGLITIFASGGSPSYQYAANSGAYSTSRTLTGMTAGIYTLYVKDVNGCVHDTVINLPQPPPITVTTLVKNTMCSSLANGSVTLLAGGGTPGYTYSADGSAFGSIYTFSSLAAGIHTFSVKDNNGCIFDTSVNILDSLHIYGIFTITPATCYGTSTGIISLTGTGGTDPYEYSISGSVYSHVNTYLGLGTGNYAISIIDSNGCVQDTSVFVPQPNPVSCQITLAEPTCYGYANGSFTISSTGGTPGYDISVNTLPYVSNSIFIGQVSGAYSIKIKDTNNCIFDTAFYLNQPTPLSVIGFTVSPVSCYGGANGTVLVGAAGATPPYMYAANGATLQFNNLLTGLAAGVQTITVRDSNYCIFDTTVLLTQPAPLVFTAADTVNPTCQGYKDGSVLLLVVGGTAPYTYSINNVNFFTNPFFDSIPEGTYTFYVRDSNQCTNDTTLTLTGYPHIIINNISVTEPLCVGYQDGSITINASGGVQPLDYQLTGTNLFQPPSTFTSLYAGNYVITITDSRDCRKDSTVTVNQPDSLLIDMQITPNQCVGFQLYGSIAAVVSGGTSPYYYTWSIPDSSGNIPYIAGLPNGIYSVTVTDAHLCADSAEGIVKYDDCCTPFIPSAFTPNNDGKDDDFGITFKGDMRVILFEVFNRYGEKVFYTEFENRAWNGTFNGMPAEVGVYYYYAKIICGNGLDHVLELKGDITLLR